MEAAPGRIKRRKAAMMTVLPDELLDEIFARLPAKSVGRFRCVSRSWAGTLSSASFVDLHLRRANPAGQPKVFLVAGASAAEDDALFYSWQAPAGRQIKKLMSLDTDTFPQPEFLCPLTKPCRGLVLLRCPPTLSYYVCNPSTGALLPVPDTRIDGGGECHVSYGLGYAATAGEHEHKLARLLCFVHDGAPVATRCEVLVLGASAHWRPSAGRAPACALSPEKAAVFLNGRLHFAGYGGEIVALDVAGETFAVLRHPAEVPATASPCLTELGGCLCVSHGLARFGEPYTAWLLRDYEAGRWEKLCCIDQAVWPDAELGVAPVDVFHDGASGRSKIVLRAGARTLLAVDPERVCCPDVLLSPKSVEAMGGRGSGYVRLGLYEESLVTPGRTAEEIVFASPVVTAWAEVLKRVPARSVARLSLVCRDWRALIGTGRFVHSQSLHAQLNNKAPRIVFSDCKNAGQFTALDDICVHAAAPPLVSHGRSKFVCSQPCHGLVIWGHASIGYYVCNPSTARRTKLRVTFDDDGDLPDTSSGECGEAAFFAGRVGLGYDTVTNRHRLVCLSYTRRSLATREYRMECAVQNIRDGGAWCSVDPPPPRPVANAPPVDVGGRLFWAVDPELAPPGPPGSAAGGEIVAMDNHTCDFEVLQGPPCGWDGELVAILELRGKLGAACAHRSSNTLVMWTMRDCGGGRSSWSVECRIELGEHSPEYSCETIVPLAVDPNGHCVLLSTGTSLGWYDTRTGTIQTIYSLGTPSERGQKFVPVVYHESLFRPDGMRRLRAPANANLQ
ncbi:unnamed protein product [Urochloa decumbens]|uniref:F-box domain-containing protein n=1 Tax=Urochloa decumbens TaxID=240449 RepID=A0ABC8YDA0_9POAL